MDRASLVSAMTSHEILEKSCQRQILNAVFRACMVAGSVRCQELYEACGGQFCSIGADRLNVGKHPGRGARAGTHPQEPLNILALSGGGAAGAFGAGAVAGTTRSGASLYSGTPLKHLIDAYVNDTYPHVGFSDFRAGTTRPLLRYAFACAQAGRLWIAFRRADDDRETEPVRTETQAAGTVGAHEAAVGRHTA
jgi:hypothetical protein